MALSTETYRRWRIVLVTVMSLLSLTACTVDMPELSEHSLDERATATDIDQQNLTESETQVEKLAFANHESTFLSHIEDARKELGAPQSHRYVEFSASNDVLWQGERLGYAVGDVLFLQQAAGDGLSAVRIDIPSGTDFEVDRDLPGDITVAPGRTEDVQVLNVRARLVDGGDNESASWSFDVTVEHPDTGWEDYVDGWHVETADGRILGTRILLHPHVGEQPFTRSLANVTIPGDVEAVRIRTHDLVSGYGPAGEIIPLGESSIADGYEVIR